MVVGVQGDWTRGIVSDPPTHLYTREMKFAGLPYLSTLFKKGIMICTGSGIGAVLSTCIQLDNWFLIWIGADLEKTFGNELMGMVDRNLLCPMVKGNEKANEKDSHAGGGVRGRRCILFDTKKEGCRPDTVKMLKDVYVAFQAEGTLLLSSLSRYGQVLTASYSCYHHFEPSRERGAYAGVQGEQHAFVWSSLGLVNPPLQKEKYHITNNIQGYHNVVT